LVVIAYTEPKFPLNSGFRVAPRLGGDWSDAHIALCGRERGLKYNCPKLFASADCRGRIHWLVCI